MENGIIWVYIKEVNNIKKIIPSMYMQYIQFMRNATKWFSYITLSLSCII